jgi:hypothetical protein
VIFARQEEFLLARFNERRVHLVPRTRGREAIGSRSYPSFSSISSLAYSHSMIYSSTSRRAEKGVASALMSAAVKFATALVRLASHCQRPSQTTLLRRYTTQLVGSVMTSSSSMILKSRRDLKEIRDRNHSVTCGGDLVHLVSLVCLVCLARRTRETRQSRASLPAFSIGLQMSWRLP